MTQPSKLDEAIGVVEMEAKRYLESRPWTLMDTAAWIAFTPIFFIAFIYGVLAETCSSGYENGRAMAVRLWCCEPTEEQG